MKKLIIGMFFTLFLFANNIHYLQPKDYYTKSDISSAYTKLLAYEETKKFIELCGVLLNNDKFTKNIDFEEMGKVKANTTDLLKQLKFFLGGWPKYSDTSFDNNSNVAGIENILKDSIDNDSNIINTPQNVINDMKNSILNLEFFKIANKIEYDIAHKNLKNLENLRDVMKNISLLLNNYVNTLSKIKEPLISQYNDKIKNELEKQYRIYTKAKLIKIINIFNKYISRNYKTIDNEI